MTRTTAVASFLLLAVQLGTVRATTFVPVSLDDLAASSVASVVGTVTAIASLQSEQGKVFTLVDIAVEEVLHGALHADAITLKEDGGEVAGRRRVVFGAPSFRQGERVLVFLTLRGDRSLRTNHLALGKFRVQRNAAGIVEAVRELDAGTTLVLPAGGAFAPTVSLDDIRAAVARSAGGAATAVSELRLAPPEAGNPSLPRRVTAAFTLLGSPPTRFFQADVGEPLSFLIDERGDSILGFDASRAAVGGAFQAWTDVPGATMTLVDGGLSAELSNTCPGPHRVRFDDPDDEIPDPVNCSGTLGVGGFEIVGITEQKVLDGVSFDRGTCATLTLANGFDGCASWTACNVAEVATHEVGHAIGLGHSSENPAEPNARLLEATMYFMARFDGRCAGLRADDVDGISFVYPTDVPPTITTGELPPAVALLPYNQTLAATGGSGTLSWTLVEGGFPGLTLSTGGVLSGSPQAFGTSFLRVRATDENNDSHTKVLDIMVLQTAPTPSATPAGSSTATGTAGATATPTATPPATSTPTATPSLGPTFSPTVAEVTPTPTAIVPDDPGDANCDGVVTAADVTSLLIRMPSNDVAPCGLADIVDDDVLDGNDLAALLRVLFLPGA